MVECQNERSQFQNKDKALEILRSRLLAQKQKEQQDAINADRAGQVGTGAVSYTHLIYVDAPDKSSGKRVQHIHIKYDGLGYIPLDELEAKEKA